APRRCVGGAGGVDRAGRGAVDALVLSGLQVGGFEKPGRHNAIIRRIGRRKRRNEKGIGCHGVSGAGKSGGGIPPGSHPLYAAVTATAKPLRWFWRDLFWLGGVAREGIAVVANL